MMAAYFKRLVNRLYKAVSVDNAHNYTDPSYIPNGATYGMKSIFVITGVSGGVHKRRDIARDQIVTMLLSFCSYFTLIVTCYYQIVTTISSDVGVTVCLHSKTHPLFT